MSEENRDMAGEAACKIYFSPVDVHQRLDRLALRKENIDIAVRLGLLARRECTENHPVTAKGFDQWSETVRALRDQTGSSGWVPDNEANQGLIANPDLGACIAVVPGDRNTGRKDAIPSTRSPRGVKTSDAVRGNNYFLFPEMEDEQIAALSDIHRDFWLLMVYVNELAERIQYELSRPVKMSERKRPVKWSERILFSDFNYGDSIPVTERDDSSSPQRTPEIVVEVKRRA